MTPLRMLGFFAAIGSSAAAPAQEPQLLRDIVTRPVATSFSPEITASTATAFFRGSAGGSGLELWRTDGTAQGTALVRDILPGPLSSLPSRLGSAGAALVFIANDGEHGDEPWSSDGTSGGTRLLRDITEGPRGSAVLPFGAAGGDVYFLEGAGDGSVNLWKTDGTPAGTDLVRAVPEVRGTPPSEPTPAGGLLFFRTGTDQTGFELWVSDGTGGGTRLLEDIAPGEPSSFPVLLEAGDGTLWFRTRRFVEEEPSGFTLRKWSASGGPTVPVRDFGDELFPVELAARGPVLYLSLVEVDDDVGRIGGAVWKTDGSPEGTIELKTFALDDDDRSPHDLTFIGEKLLFVVGFLEEGAELWSSGGTPESTVRLLQSAGRIGQLVPSAGSVFFVEEGPEKAAALWRTDGSAAGTSLLGRFPSQGDIALDSLAAAPGGALFGIGDTLRGREIWFSDGTPQGTKLVQGGFGIATEDSFPRLFLDAGTTTYFIARSAAGGEELWRTDGNTVGTTAVEEVLPPGGGLVSGIARAGNEVFLSVIAPGSAQLWRSDGTGGGTSVLEEFPPTAGISGLIGSGNRVFFHVGDALESELWVYEPGAEEPARLLGEVFGIGSLTDGRGTAYFVTGNQTSAARLWRSNGTVSGTFPLRTFEPDVGAFTLGSIVESGGAVYFLANETGGRGELWKSDGTGPGTVRLRSFTSTPTRPFLLVDGGTRVYLFAYDGIREGELWASNGTPAGTVRLESFELDPFGGGSTDTAVADGVLYFQAIDGSGAEPWRSDGTPAGTRRLADVNPGPAGSDPTGFLAAGDEVYFAATSPLGGRELWRTDGTGAGTELLKDLFPGSQGSEPRELFRSGDVVYLSVDDGVHGVEPWAFVPPGPPPPPRERGDANGDTRINISDPVYLLLCLFLGETPCSPDPCESDIDGNGVVNVTDPIFLLDFLFRGGPRPPACE